MTMKFYPEFAKTGDAAVENSVSATVEAIHAKSWMQDMGEKKQTIVSANELTSLSAMIAYVAFSSGENEFRIERRLSDRFNIPNVSCLPAGEFDSALRYLADGLRA